MKKCKRAFSIIELILVVVILGLIVSVFVPATVRIKEIARENAVTANISKIIRAGQRYNMDKAVKSVDYKTLVDAKYIDKLTPILGESYDKIVVDSTGGKVTVDNPAGEPFEKEY